MLILNAREVADLLDPAALIEALAGALADLSAGRAGGPPRTSVAVPGHGDLLVMPAYLPAAGVLATKLVGVYPANPARGLPSHPAVIVVCAAETGVPLALLEGTQITAARTAAGSALATRLLARPDARVLAVLGTGVQAKAHLRTLARVWPLTEIRIAGRDPAKARALAAELAAEVGCPIRAVETYPAALAGAEIVCATTHSPDPVVRREWLEPGVHINSVGFTAGREVDAATVAAALVVVESRAAALAPYPAGSNDLIEPLQAGQIGPDHIQTEIGELVAGTRPGRTHPDQITLYKSVGLAIQDAAAAALVLTAARAGGRGVEIDLTGGLPAE